MLNNKTNYSMMLTRSTTLEKYWFTITVYSLTTVKYIKLFQHSLCNVMSHVVLYAFPTKSVESGLRRNDNRTRADHFQWSPLPIIR